MHQLWVNCTYVTVRNIQEWNPTFIHSVPWPLTHFMLCCDSLSCYILLGQEFTVYPSMSGGEAWCVFQAKPSRSFFINQGKIYYIWSHLGHLDPVPVNLILAFSCTWPSWLWATLSFKCWCSTSGGYKPLLPKVMPTSFPVPPLLLMI